MIEMTTPFDIFDIKDIRPEDALIFCCARTTISPETADHINSLLRHGIDWAYLIQRLIHHKVLPLVFQIFRQNFLNQIPPPVMNYLQNYYENIAKRNLFLTAKLLQLIDLLETHHIPAIPYKGPALAFLAYGNICFRQFSDLDILVDLHDYLKVRDILLAHGYRLADDYGWECSLVDNNHRVAVDLHQRIAPAQFPIYLDFHSLQQHLKALPVAGGKINTFCPEDMLLILCIQLVKDGWEYKPPQLSKICDIAELVHSYPSMDWKRVINESKKLGCQRILFVSLSVAHKLLNTPVPEVFLRILTQPYLNILANHIYNKLIYRTTSSYSGQLSMENFHFKVRERWRDKLYPYYYQLKKPLIPNEKDHDFISLPEPLSALYYFIRPIRLMRDYGRIAWYILKDKYLNRKKRC